VTDARKARVGSDATGTYIEFRGCKFRGHECSKCGSEVVIDYFTTYIKDDGSEKITSIAFLTQIMVRVSCIVMRSRRTGKEALYTRVVQDKRSKSREEPVDYTHPSFNDCYVSAMRQLRRIPGVLRVEEVSGMELVVIVNEHGDVDRQQLLDFEDRWDVSIRVHAAQGRE
jgi:hypothetical protein